MNDNANLEVIVVDDDADIGLMIKSILTYHNFKVTACTSADQMLTLLGSSHVPSLIIMDMLLSGTDGRDVCKSLKAAKNTRTIPILMISAHPNARETCLAAGADDFLEKPFDVDALLGRSKYLMSLN